MANGWQWTGTAGVNVPALVVCFALIAVWTGFAIYRIRKPQTRWRGAIMLSIVLVPTILSAAAAAVRVVAL